MVKSPWKREENGSQSPCRIKSSMSMEESKPQSPGEDHFDTTEQHAQLDEGQIKTEPDDDQSVESERDPFDELAELLEEENVPVYLVQMPLVAPPPPSITLPDDCFLFTRRTKVEIASAVPSSSSSVNECLDSPHQRAAGLAPIEVHSQKKSRSRRGRSRSGGSSNRQESNQGRSLIRSLSSVGHRNRQKPPEHREDRTTSSRKGARSNSSSMETKKCKMSRGRSPGKIKKRNSTSRISTETDRGRTRSPNGTSSSDREHFRKKMSYQRLSRRKFAENGHVFGRRRSRSGSPNRRHWRRDSFSPIISPQRIRREFRPRQIRRYSPKRLSGQRCLSREPTKSPSRCRSRQSGRSYQHPQRRSRSGTRQYRLSREPPIRHSRSRSRQHRLSREPPIRHSRSRSHSAVNKTRMNDNVSPVCSAGSIEIFQPSDCTLPPLGPVEPMAYNSPRPILPIVTSRFENPVTPSPVTPYRHLPQMPAASNHMWYTQTHYTHFQYSTTTMQDGPNWQAPVYGYGDAPPPALGPHDLRHRLGSTRSLPLGPCDLRHRIQGRPECFFPTENTASPYNVAPGQTVYQYYPNGYY
ncbi:serine/arginine repetitive matrix protein 1 [Drosophila persimilis]|uniref:serine/arginine repetitive matrix protein 1 n=1 Tax=Drosophila persimilis TaxID=7234 RepID=UPI000F098E2B|nr:serine/arginine repetitive matrix protein 1 [Drosophila persimilis]